jgi:hypothetical protein
VKHWTSDGLPNIGPQVSRNTCNDLYGNISIKFCMCYIKLIETCLKQFDNLTYISLICISSMYKCSIMKPNYVSQISYVFLVLNSMCICQYLSHFPCASYFKQYKWEIISLRIYISLYNFFLIFYLYMDPEQIHFSSQPLNLFTKIQFDILSALSQSFNWFLSA